MPTKTLSRLSLRAKVTGISLTIAALALAFSATISILQMRYQIELEEGRSADSLALSVARAAELSMNVQDTKELSRLASSFLRNPDIQFIAAYGTGPSPLVAAVRDRTVWDAYQAGTLTAQLSTLAEHSIDRMVERDEFAGGLEPEPNDDRSRDKHSGPVGRIVVGLSTESTRLAQRQQSLLTFGVTLGAASVGAWVLFFTLGKWLRRLQNLVGASQSIASGDFTHSINDRHTDEIGNLGRSFEAMRVALVERDRRLRGFTETLQDQVKQRTSDLEHAVLAAEEANRAKSMFLANMSHELRTPLNGVIGMVDLMLATPTSPQQRRYCDIVRVSAHSLLDLINDILDFSKIEAGKLELDATDFDLCKTVETVAQMFGDRAQKKGLELVCAIDPPVPKQVRGDPVRLRQVIVNLVNNAIKFTERGEVCINVTAVRQDDKDCVVKVLVRDTGPGIPKDRMDRLFKSFSQVDASTTRKYGGTGLGLAISQRIVEMMAGEIGVLSEEKKGSTFWFTVRLQKGATAPQPQTPDLRALRVLVVDENAANRQSILAQLRSWSVRADAVASTTEASESLRGSAHADPYRIVIVDLHLAGNGAEKLVREIKSNPMIQQTAIIGVSSLTDSIKPAEMREIDLSDCLTKPVLPSMLYNAIAGIVSGTSPAKNPQAAEPTSTHLAGVSILLAEDNDINQMVVEEILTQCGCKITMVKNGREAVDAATSGNFDAILMDCQMPEMDGLEATRAIRKLESESKSPRHTPIIALTANAIKGDREICLAAGMDGYVTKPIAAEELLLSIGAVMPEGRLKPQQAPVPEQPVTESAPIAPSSDQPAVNFQALCRRCMGNKKLAAKALETFGAAIESYVRDLSSSLQAGDAKNAGAAAHKIKGAAGNVSAEQVSRIAGELEMLSKNDQLSQSQAALSQLQREVDRAREFITTRLRELIDA